MKCRICGVKESAVLEAAHIVADSAGGAASSDNVLLLCANHHVAMDAGLFTWDRESESPRWRVEEF